MKIQRHLTYILAGLTLSSCNSYFDLEDIEAEEKLVVYCLPTAGCDTTIVQLSKTVPLQSSEVPPKGIPRAFIDFSVNGEPQEVLWTEESLGMVPEESFYVIRKFKAGDRIDIMADVKGMTAVTSNSIVPEAFPLIKVEVGRTSNEEMDMRQFRVTFKDDAATKDYYGIRILKMALHQDSIYSEWENKWTCNSYSRVYIERAYVDSEPLLDNQVGLDAIFDFDYDYYQYLYIWDDSRIAGKEYTVKIGTQLQHDSRNTFGASIFNINYFYKLCLYRLSAETYGYLKSINDINNNELGQNGLAPVRSHYTNIVNGFGIVGACNLYQTEWLENQDTLK